MLQLYPALRSESLEERVRLRPFGRNAERYHEAIHGTVEVVQEAERLGLWGVACIEHHFWSEGYEVGPAPGVVNAFWAANTKRIRVGALGYVMTTQNPIRVAEETAVLDHLSNGRYFVGLARGYQSRWMQTIGQHYGARATTSPEGEDNAINRRIFEEHVEMLLKAWTQESIEHNSDQWQVPYPHGEGAQWGMWPATERLGALGEIVDERVRRVSVVPAPYQKPHPPVFEPTSRSIETSEFCGRHGFIPVHFTPIERAATFARAYTDAAAAAGRPVPYGKNQTLCRWIHTGNTMQEARAKMIKYDVELFRSLALIQGRVIPEGRDPKEFMLHGTDDEWCDALLANGLFIIGTVDDVKRQMIEQWQQLPAEYCCFIMHYDIQPKDVCVQELEMFMTHIKPELDKITDRAYSGD
jgi:alkanesulfonate monooxygenase SsuD/methylene tetrahydromethanopterin reductase-like flavin-dependent oxidoreductase (luciferase family)